LLKIGIIGTKKYLKNQLQSLLSYLKKRVEISVYLEESFLLTSSSSKHLFNEDLFFVKGKGNVILNLVRYIEKETSIPVINPFNGIWRAMNRFLNSTYLQKAGIRVPPFCLVPEKLNPPFKDFIIKNIIDQEPSSFIPKIESRNGHIHVSDKRALNETEGAQKYYHYYYYQQYIKSQVEYKIYGIGEQLFYFERIPTIKNPHRMVPKIEIKKISELEEPSRKVMEIFNLKVVSLDFLKSKEGYYYLIDVNSGPKFISVKNGAEILGEFLIDYVKK